MFNNFINYNDLKAFLKLVYCRDLNGVRRILCTDNETKVKKAWKHVQNPPVSWYNIPAVRTRWNVMITGNPAIEYQEYITQKYLADRQSLKALSLACGNGHRELIWVKNKKFERIDAYDLSEDRIAYARKSAYEAGYGDIIHYNVNNVYSLPLKNEYYDVVLAEQSLHHFTPLQGIMERINSFLKPGGLLIVNEFVGPTRFQWTDKQLEVTNVLLSILPSKYKILWDSRQIKENVCRPSRLSMVIRDPSEAVESSNIVPLLHNTFDIVEMKGYGGTILHLLLSGIAYNFLTDESEASHLLSLCCEIEDLLIKNGEIQDDFIVAVCKNKR